MGVLNSIFNAFKGMFTHDDARKIAEAQKELDAANNSALASFSLQNEVSSCLQVCQTPANGVSSLAIPGMSSAGVCSPDEAVLARNQPCDIADADVAEVAGSKGKSYLYSEGAWHEEKPLYEKQRKVSINGQVSGAPVGDRLEVIADEPGGTSPTKIQVILALVATHDSSSHPMVSVNGSDTSIFWAGTKAEESEFYVYRKRYGADVPGGAMGKFLLDKYWPLNVEPNTYNVNINACGIRDEGPAIGSHTFQVVAYPCDQYTLRLKVPPFKETTHELAGTLSLSKDGAMLVKSTSQTDYEKTLDGRQRSRTTESSRALDPLQLSTESKSTSKTDSQGYTYTESETTGIQQGDPNYYELTHSLQHGDRKLVEHISSLEEPKPVTLFSEPPVMGMVEFEFRRNGTVDDTAIEISKILNALKYYEHTFKKIMNFIRDLTPQVGWKFTLDVSFFSGELALGWGYREHTDHQVFFAWSADVNLTVVSANVALSFGVSLSEFLVAELKGTISGSVEINRAIKRDAPGQSLLPTGASEGVKGEITGDLNGHAAAGIGWLRIERKAGINCGFVVEASVAIEQERGLYIAAKIEFKPLQFYTIIKNIDEPDEAKYYKLTDKKTIFDGSFPEAKEDSSP
jgi:hypothetical protein